MVLHPLVQRECYFCPHVPFSPFERVQTSFSAAGRHSSSTFPFLILESAYKAVGPGFSGPGDSWITAWTRLQVGMVNILPAWHYPPPLLPHPPVPCQAALAVTELMASSCSALALWTLSWVAVWFTAGRSSLASPALRVSSWEMEETVVGQSLCPPPPAAPPHSLCVSLVQKERKRH